MKKGILYGVGIGPGDSELITVKAMNIISNCKYVATPQTGKSESLALSIVSEIMDLSDKIILNLTFPMTKDKTILNKSHEDAANSIKEILDNGYDVVMLNLGDITIYSTFSYVMDRLLNDGYDVELVPGITSFCASASKLKISLTSMDGPLHLIPTSSYDIKEALQLSGTKVFMKIGKSMPELIEKLKELNLEDNVYSVQNCGLENEKVSKGLDGLNGKIGYFTIVIVK